jgi:1-pyrroline-5-carboxylate dehydrogenase
MRRRKYEFNAWLVLEVGKSWAEAEADTAEAIDFMEFYARQALRYAEPQPLTPSPLTDEVNEVKYIPLGAGVVIPPWNFPLAILAGMATAAIVAGNTVVLKPRTTAPLSQRNSWSSWNRSHCLRSHQLSPGGWPDGW